MKYETRGRKCKLTTDDEDLIERALREVAEKGTTLSREGIKDAFQVYVSRMSAERQRQIQFKEKISRNGFIT